MFPTAPKGKGKAPISHLESQVMGGSGTYQDIAADRLSSNHQDIETPKKKKEHIPTPTSPEPDGSPDQRQIPVQQKRRLGTCLFFCTVSLGCQIEGDEWNGSEGNGFIRIPS